MKKRIYLFGAAVVAMMASCSTTDTPEPIPSEPQTPVAEEIVLPEPDIDAISQQDIDRSTDFALRLLNAGLEINKNENMVISPVSIFSVLSMAVNGADEYAKSKILMALGYDAHADLKEINELNYHILTALPQLDPEKVKLEFSNSYWTESGRTIMEEYKNAIEAYFNAEDGGCDPNGVEGMNAINTFVNAKTHGLIDNFLVIPLTANRIILLNTSYLKAEWKNKFNPEFTSNTGIFKNIDGTEKNIDFMHNEECFKVSSLDGINSITLPYGNGNYSMTVFYPANEGIEQGSILSFDDMIQRLTPKKVNELIGAQRLENVTLTLPKFECDESPQFLDLLSKLGLNPLEYFYFLKNSRLKLLSAHHAAKIKVNEDGTEAGGASYLGFTDCETLKMIVNRPFVYLVREESTGIVLFAGAMTKF